jgi:hypothetical protein
MDQHCARVGEIDVETGLDLSKLEPVGGIVTDEVEKGGAHDAMLTTGGLCHQPR